MANLCPEEKPVMKNKADRWKGWRSRLVTAELTAVLGVILWLLRMIQAAGR